MEKLNVFKVGGKVIDQEETLRSFLEDFVLVKGKKLLVHGGGKIASQYAAQLGVESKMVNGRRITGKETLDIVMMVYGGLVNKRIVAILQSLKCNAVGLSGADLNIIEAEKRNPYPVDYGFVGDVRKVNAAILKQLIGQDVVPVLAPLTHDHQGQMLNTNADTIASAVARALSVYYEVDLYFCFEKKGVLRDASDESSVIHKIIQKDFISMCEKGIIAEGMIPKLENAFACLNEGVSKVYICNHQSIADLDHIDQQATLISS